MNKAQTLGALSLPTTRTAAKRLPAGLSVARRLAVVGDMIYPGTIVATHKYDLSPAVWCALTGELHNHQHTHTALGRWELQT